MLDTNDGPIDSPGRIETRGIETIPDAERRSRPRDLGFVFFGTQMTYGSLLIGALPIVFGLDWFGSLTAIVVGSILGAAAVGALAVMAPKAGTTSTVISSAFFGIRGRYVGSFITQVIDLGYFAMVLWISAPPLVQAGHLLFGLPDGSAALTAVLLVLAILVLGLGIFGHATVVASEKFSSYGNGICLVLLVLCCLGHVHGAPDPKAYPLVLKTWWPSWMLAVTVMIANAISYAPYAGDYARYIPERTPGAALFGWSFGGMLAGCVIGSICGTVIGLAVVHPNEVVGEMYGFVPHLLLLPIALVGLIGNVSNGGMVVYNGMLDLQAILWRLTRLQVGFIFSAIGIAIGYLGLIAFNLTASIVALCSIVTVLVTPWILIIAIGYFRHGRRFRARDLQAFAGSERGIYWYSAGVSIPAVVAWLVGVTVGLLFSDTSLFVGPLAASAGGVDLSFVAAAVVASFLYVLLDRIFPSARSIRRDNIGGAASVV
jgi:purine-cytosine permease-like protein